MVTQTSSWRVAGRLRAELLELDVPAMDPIDEQAASHPARGLAALAGWLVVQLLATGANFANVLGMSGGAFLCSASLGMATHRGCLS